MNLFIVFMHMRWNYAVIFQSVNLQLVHGLTAEQFLDLSRFL